MEQPVLGRDRDYLAAERAETRLVTEQREPQKRRHVLPAGNRSDL